MTKKEVYEMVINTIMKVDPNSSLDTLLKECDNDLDCACDILLDIFDRIIEEKEELSDEECNLYIDFQKTMVAYVTQK